MISLSHAVPSSSLLLHSYPAVETAVQMPGGFNRQRPLYSGPMVQLRVRHMCTEGRSP